MCACDLDCAARGNKMVVKLPSTFLSDRSQRMVEIEIEIEFRSRDCLFPQHLPLLRTRNLWGKDVAKLTLSTRVSLDSKFALPGIVRRLTPPLFSWRGNVRNDLRFAAGDHGSHVIRPARSMPEAQSWLETEILHERLQTDSIYSIQTRTTTSASPSQSFILSSGAASSERLPIVKIVVFRSSR